MKIGKYELGAEAARGTHTHGKPSAGFFNEYIRRDGAAAPPVRSRSAGRVLSRSIIRKYSRQFDPKSAANKESILLKEFSEGSLVG